MIITSQNLQPNYFRKVSSNEQPLSRDVVNVTGIVVSILLFIHVIYRVISFYRTHKLQERIKHQQIAQLEKEEAQLMEKEAQLVEKIVELIRQCLDNTKTSDQPD